MSLVHLPDTRKTVILARDRYNVKETMLISSCIAIGERKKKQATTKRKKQTKKNLANYKMEKTFYLKFSRLGKLT